MLVVESWGHCVNVPVVFLLCHYCKKSALLAFYYMIIIWEWGDKDVVGMNPDTPAKRKGERA